jgi:transcriptional regulator with XRE-family HTH domain
LEDKEGNLVKQVCKEYNLTVNQLSEKLDIPRGTIGRWMSGKDLPRTAELFLNFMSHLQITPIKVGLSDVFKKIDNFTQINEISSS